MKWMTNNLLLGKYLYFPRDGCLCNLLVVFAAAACATFDISKTFKPKQKSNQKHIYYILICKSTFDLLQQMATF